jgi:hypothetical protein
MEISREYWSQALIDLYPNVTIIRGDVPMDVRGDVVSYDADDVNQKASELEAYDIAREEKREAIRASAMRKLVENAGLTVEEVEEFLKVDL